MAPNAFSRRKPATKLYSVQREFNRKQMRGSSEAECTQSEKACFEAAIPSEAKPTMHQEEKEQAEQRVES
jgi:hypothetical protein